MTLHNYQTNSAIKKKIFCGRCSCIFTIFIKIYAMGALVYLPTFSFSIRLLYTVCDRLSMSSAIATRDRCARAQLTNQTVLVRGCHAPFPRLLD